MMRILPLEHLRQHGRSPDDELRRLEDGGERDLSSILRSPHVLCDSGRAAIGALMEHLRLRREDEVFITTTTETSFVSTCVSATIFNYCRISRVPTDATKAIFVVHNFGFPHPRIGELRVTANERGIPLIEDCAFALDSYSREGVRLGSMGDYAIYSLTKILPLERGGILCGADLPGAGRRDAELERSINRWIPKLDAIKRLRVRNYRHLADALPDRHVYPMPTGENPFMFALYSDNFEEIYRRCDSAELGRTHVRREVHVPVNAFIEIEEYHPVIDLLREAHSP